jgi:uncharacterized cupin superfamily protein
MTALYDRQRIMRSRREALPMPNIFEPDFNQRREHPGFRALRARVGWELATQRLGASVWEIEPGEAAYPYHYHLAEEEILVVLLGRPSVRTEGAWRELEPGDVLSFRRGRGGAHQVANWGGVTARFLAVSTSDTPDLVVYPDSSKLGAFERLPDRAGLFEIFRMADAVEYHDGERPPAPPS